MVRKVSRAGVLSCTLILVVSASSLFGSQAAKVELPSATAVLESAKSVLIPSIGYEVSVSQRVEGAKSGGELMAIPVRKGLAEFIPGKGLKRVRGREAQSAQAVPSPTVMVDLGAFIDELLSYPVMTIELVDLGGRPNYHIHGKSNDSMSECAVWIDRERNSVTRVEVYLLQKLFAVIDVNYTAAQGDYWLPGTIILRHSTDSSRVILEFSEYRFTR